MAVILKQVLDGKNYIRCFFYKIHHFGGKVEAFKMCIDTNTFLDLWNETSPRVKKIEAITRDQYYEHIVGRQVLTYPISKLTNDQSHNDTTYEMYEVRVQSSYIFGG